MEFTFYPSRNLQAQEVIFSCQNHRYHMPAPTFNFQRQSPLHSSLALQDPRLVAIPNLITLLNLFTLDHVDVSRAEPILYS